LVSNVLNCAEAAVTVPVERAVVLKDGANIADVWIELTMSLSVVIVLIDAAAAVYAPDAVVVVATIELPYTVSFMRVDPCRIVDPVFVNVLGPHTTIEYVLIVLASIVAVEIVFVNTVLAVTRSVTCIEETRPEAASRFVVMTWFAMAISNDTEFTWTAPVERDATVAVVISAVIAFKDDITNWLTVTVLGTRSPIVAVCVESVSVYRFVKNASCPYNLPEDIFDVVIDCIVADWAVRRPVDSVSKKPAPTFTVRITSATTESDVVLTEGTMTVFTNRFPVDREFSLKKETSAMPPVATVVEMLLPYARGAVIKLVINVPVESEVVDIFSIRATGARVIPVDTVTTNPVLMVAILA